MGPRFQQKHTHIRKGLFRGTINTYAKNSSHLSTTVWTFGLLCGKVQRSRLRLVITWFQGRFDFRLNVSPTLSVLLGIFARTFVQICLGVPGSVSFRKYARTSCDFFLPTVNAWLLRPLRRPVIGRDIFSALAPVLGPWQKKLAMSPTFIVHGGQRLYACWTRSYAQSTIVEQGSSHRPCHWPGCTSQTT